VRGLVAAHGLRLGAIGLSLGIVAALALGRVLARTFSAVPALDIPSVLGSLVALGGVTALASFLPARHASRADPVTVLRDE
jgi:putative ABC transport system permease protein